MHACILRIMAVWPNLILPDRAPNHNARRVSTYLATILRRKIILVIYQVRSESFKRHERKKSFFIV